MDKYLEAEKALAERLYPDKQWEICGDQVRYYEAGCWWMAPRWCRDWGTCGPLMVKYGCYPRDVMGITKVVAIDIAGRDSYSAWVRLDDHPTKDVAAMFAVVRAVTAKLTAQQCPRYVVDGTNDEGCFSGDGDKPPFVIFDTVEQKNLTPYYFTRTQAEYALSDLLWRNRGAR